MLRCLDEEEGLFEKLPIELIEVVSSFLDLPATFSVLCVCKAWCAMGPNIWSNLLQHCSTQIVPPKRKEKDIKWLVLSKHQLDGEKLKTFSGTASSLSSGILYEGEWIKGMRHGFGSSLRIVEEFKGTSLTAADCVVEKVPELYQGEWREDKKVGFGEFSWAGRKYIGHFDDNLFHGKGTLHWDDGDRYEGDFENGVQNGKGAFYWADGDTYVGEIKNSTVTGVGVFTWVSGNRYEGEFQGGEKNGRGKFFWTNGDTYNGSWTRGNMHGEGFYNWANGNTVAGKWLDDKRTEGTFYEAPSKRAFSLKEISNSIHTHILHPKVQRATKSKTCTYSLMLDNPHRNGPPPTDELLNEQWAKGRIYFQYLYIVESTRGDPKGICVVCMETCAKANRIPVVDPTAPILGGNFQCSCGRGRLEKPCRAFHQQ